MLISHVHEWNIISVTRDTVLHACHLNETESREPFAKQPINKKKKKNLASQKYIPCVCSLFGNESIHKNLKYNLVKIETAKYEYKYINNAGSKSWNFSKENSTRISRGNIASIRNLFIECKRDVYDTKEIKQKGPDWLIPT